jgi:hypothetical protein
MNLMADLWRAKPIHLTLKTQLLRWLSAHGALAIYPDSARTESSAFTLIWARFA